MVKKINNRQLLFLIISVIISTADIFLPSIVAKYAKSDSWFSVILATLFGLLDAYVVISLCMEYKNKTFVEILQAVLGKYVGIALGIIFIITLLYINILVIRELGEILKTLFLPGIPINLIIILASTVSAYGAYKGIETIVRTNEVAIAFGLFILSFVILFSLRLVHFNRYLPMFENGIYSSVQGALPMVTWMAEIIIVAMIFPYLNNPKGCMKTSLAAMFALGVMFMGGTFTVLVFGADATAKLIFSTFNTIESIDISRVIRFDVLIMSVWVAGIFIKSMLLLFISVEAVVRTFNLKNFNAFIIPNAVITSVFAMIDFDNMIQLIRYFERILFLLYAAVFFVMPLLLLLITKFKKAIM